MRITAIPPELRELMRYDRDSGELHWVTPPKKSRRRGSLAGCVNKEGYVVVTYCGRQFSGHRLAWFLETGSDAPSPIDHIDGNRARNVWGNLRLATSSQNAANRRGNGGGLKGVDVLPGGRFQARISFGGKLHYLGLFDTAEEAHAAYVAKAKELFGEFARAA